MLRPRSDHGQVYRVRSVELGEVLWYIVVLAVSIAFVWQSFRRGDWGWVVGWPVAMAVLVSFARLLLFRPHLVLGEDALIIVDPIGSRRLPYSDVRSATGAQGRLLLVLKDGSRLVALGTRFHWNPLDWPHYGVLADAINERAASTRRR